MKKRDRKQEYIKNRDKILKRVKKYASENRKKIKKYQREYRQRTASKVARLKLARKQRLKHAIKFRARNIVNKAVKRGVIKKQPCLFCKNPKTEAHHKNYKRPMDIIWVCRLHHEHLHGRMLWR